MNTIKPNRRFYSILLCAAVLVSVIAVFIPMLNPWFTIITGIGCGGIASVIVAWLVDEANCSSISKRNMEIHSLLWAALSLFAYSYTNMYKVLHEEEKECEEERLTWLEWRQKVINDLKNKVCK